MSRLSQEIVHHILEFAGKVKYRHGKYMYQISNDDERYTMLLHLCRFKSPPGGGDSSGKVTLFKDGVLPLPQYKVHQVKKKVFITINMFVPIRKLNRMLLLERTAYRIITPMNI